MTVLDGTVELVCGNDRRRLGPGDAVAVGRNVPCRVTVDADARLLCLVVPAGIDALADLAEATLDGDDLAARLAAAGVTLLPAAWGAAS